MSRNLMPKSGAMAPYIVVNRDAAVAGVFSVDGEAGAVVLTSKYLQLSKYTVDKAATDASINSINESIGNINTALGGINTTLNTKAAKGANNDITELNALTKAIKISQGGTGGTTLASAKVALEVDRLRQQDNGTFVVSPDGKYSLFVYNSGDFGLIDSATAAVSAMKVAFGGTGGTTPKAARKNLNIPVGSLAEVIPNGENVLNYIAVAGQSGYYSSGDSVTHTPPVGEGWWTYNFHCHGVDINGAAQYGVLKATGLSGSTWINVLDGTGNWKGWQEQFNAQSTVQFSNGGTGADSKEGAKTNLGIDRFKQSATETMMYAPGVGFRITARPNGEWGTWRDDTGTWIPLSIAAGGTGGVDIASARNNLGLGDNQDVQFRTLNAFSIVGRGGAWTPAVRKLKDQQTQDANKNNQLSYLENDDMAVTNYIITVPQDNWSIQYVWQLARTGGATTWFSMRSDNGLYTPEGRVAIQGSDVRIKDNFNPPKQGAWERVGQIGIMEFTYKGNNIPQRGYLAQQMEAIDPVYVFSGGQSTDDNGKDFEILNVNDKAVMADVITVVQELQKQIVDCKEQIKYLQRELNALRSSK